MIKYNTLISVSELNDHIYNPDLILFDARFNLAAADEGFLDYKEAHIPKALFLHLEQDLSSPVTELTGRHPLPAIDKLIAKFASLGVSDSKQIVVYDDCAGIMAVRCWWLLSCLLGHKNTALLDGGYSAWCQAGYGITSTVEACQPTEFNPRVNADMYVDTNDLIEQMERKNICLVDARNAQRFRGEIEPIDPVAGHIPGAINRPMEENLQGNFFKSATDLRLEWQELLGDTKPEQVVHMCGSGVTACHNLLAMEIAGLRQSKLYPGSWSEWIREPERPIGVGDS